MENKVNIITSFPKSGNTWMRFIIYDLFFNEKNIFSESSIGIKKLVPDFHTIKTENNSIFFDNELKNKKIFLKTHYAFNQVKSIPIDKVIVIIRNPYDVLVSLINYYELKENKKTDFLEYFCQHHTLPFLKRFNFPNWEDHFESWINSGRDFHVVKYSDLIEDFENQIKYLCNFLNFDISNEKIDFIKKNTSFKNLQKMEINERQKNLNGFFNNDMRGKKNYFINKGVCGNYKFFFNNSEITKLENSFKKLIEKYKIK